MLLSEKITAIKRCGLFSDLSTEEILNISQVTKDRTYKPGEVILREKITPAQLAILVSGPIYASKGGKIVTQINIYTNPITLGANDIILDQESEHTWSAASSECNVLIIQKNHFFTIMHQCPELLVHILQDSEFENFTHMTGAA